MGLRIDIGIIDIMKEGLVNPFKGKSILMLGKQDVSISLDELVDIAKKLQYKLNKIEKIDIDSSGNIDSYSLFYMLGFKQVDALDVSTYENATVIFDLSSNEEIPNEIREKYDYIIDGGTFEHLFNVTNGFQNVAKMLKCGGKVYHFVPSNNSINHGFYSLCPTLFEEYYSANNFFINDISLLYIMNNNDLNTLTNKVDCRLLNISDYYTNEEIQDKVAYVQCVVTKKENSSWNKWPIQKKFFVEEIKQKMIKENLNLANGKYGKKSIAIYGLGKVTEEIIKYYSNIGSRDKISFLIDRNKSENIYDFEVKSIEEIEDNSIKAIIIGSIGHQEEIYYRIKSLENKKIEIIKLIDNSEVL